MLRDERASGAMIQSSGVTHTYSLQTYAGSIGKLTYFPTGQLRARPLCTTTSTALTKHHHAADDNISMLYVPKQPQYAVEQYGHTSWKHTILNAAVQWHSHIDFTLTARWQSVVSQRITSAAVTTIWISMTVQCNLQQITKLPHWNNLTACNDADISPETIHSRICEKCSCLKCDGAALQAAIQLISSLVSQTHNLYWYSYNTMITTATLPANVYWCHWQWHKVTQNVTTTSPELYHPCYSEQT